MTTIANKTALALVAANQAVLIDVREPAEFWEGHLSGAVNLPSTTFQIEDYQAFRHQTICLICNSGSRAKQVAAKLSAQDFPRVCLAEEQMDTLAEAQMFNQVETYATLASGWTIDRQFRMTLGLLLLTFLAGYFLWSPVFIIIPIILCAGLTITSIIDRCYLRVGIAMLPWNKNRREGTVAPNHPLSRSDASVSHLPFDQQSLYSQS